MLCPGAGRDVHKGIPVITATLTPWNTVWASVLPSHLCFGLVLTLSSRWAPFKSSKASFGLPSSTQPSSVLRSADTYLVSCILDLLSAPASS